MLRKIREDSLVLGIIFLTVLLVMLLQNFGYKSYSRYVTDTLHYDQGIVVEISDEDIEYDKSLKIYLGTQNLKVRMTEGTEKGTVIEVTNYLTKTHNVVAKVNMPLIINVDQPDEVEPYYTVFNYDRRFAMLACAAVLVAAIICIGGGKGIRAVLGLLYSLFVVIGFLLPAVFSGWSPIWTSILAAVLSTAVTLLLLNGQSKKTAAAILATMIGMFFSLAFYTVMSVLLHIDGFSSSEAEGLILINEGTGLQIHDVLFAGVLISSLGAIMDVGMSIVSALYEVYLHNPTLTAKEIFQSGIEIGKDMIGTMTNTLILAFTGSALISLLVFISYQVQFNQLFNSNYLSIEIAQGLCGTFGIVLTIPAASAIMAVLLAGRKKNDKASERMETE
ncbi:YibE/F family protein [Mediterraneibacter sp.]